MKKSISLILAIVMMMGIFAACGGKNQTEAREKMAEQGIPDELLMEGVDARVEENMITYESKKSYDEVKEFYTKYITDNKVETLSEMSAEDMDFGEDVTPEMLASIQPFWNYQGKIGDKVMAISITEQPINVKTYVTVTVVYGNEKDLMGDPEDIEIIPEEEAAGETSTEETSATEEKEKDAEEETVEAGAETEESGEETPAA